MATTKTLAQVVEEVENGPNSYDQTKIKMGPFESFADFMIYFNCHYRPMLEQIRDGFLPSSDEGERMLSFFASDILDIFGTTE